MSQETFTTCCMNMSHMFKVIMSCEETFYVHGHFPSSSGGCGGLRNPFPKNFAPTLPCSPKFSSFTRTYAYTGYNEETCEAKCFMFGYFKEGIRRTHRTSRRVRFVHSVWWDPNFPMSQLCAGKEGFSFVILVQFQWCPYIYICIYMLLSRLILTVAIASLKFLDL